MKWTKKGLIFRPSNNYDWMRTHAALPIADHIKDDIFKIYFSSRDSQNRSFTTFIEIDITNPKKILHISEKPIISPGEIGSFDDSGAMGSCLVNFGEKKYLYYIGWNLGKTVPYRNSIGLAISNDDGNTFEKFSEGPILERNYKEPHFLASCHVNIEDEIWKMWYLSCVRWELVNNKPNPFYHIKYAESENGIDWIREGKVCIDFKDENEWAISKPCVIKNKDRYQMWYSNRGVKSYRIGYAESKNGIEWKRLDDEAGIDISASGWDSKMIEYPFVFSHKEMVYMLYNGNDYGKSGFGYAVLE